MARLHNRGKKKINKALYRVEKVVVMETRKTNEQQRKWKGELAKRQK